MRDPSAIPRVRRDAKVSSGVKLTVAHRRVPSQDLYACTKVSLQTLGRHAGVPLRQRNRNPGGASPAGVLFGSNPGGTDYQGGTRFEANRGPPAPHQAAGADPRLDVLQRDRRRAVSRRWDRPARFRLVSDEAHSRSRRSQPAHRQSRQRSREAVPHFQAE